jgi:hypothetical protein
MHSSGVHGLRVYCADYRRSFATAISADRWTDDVRFSDLELLFVSQACGERLPTFGQISIGRRKRAAL